jgi:uncharacterized repeat protein (TIGR01451 family)
MSIVTGRRLGLSLLGALVAILVLPAVAGAATHPAKVSNITITPSLAGHAGFGLDHFDVNAITPGDPFAFPFVTGSKIGHCVEETIGIANDPTATLRTDGDLSLDNSDPLNTIGAGNSPGAQRVEWILLDSYRTSPGDASGVQGAAHQSAIWQLTNPSSTDAGRIAGSSTDEQQASARATQLLADSAVYSPSVTNSAALSVDGGGALHTCAGTSRTLTVTGSPWTDAKLTLSGSAVFHDSGVTATTVGLGATGSAQVQIDSTGPGQVDVTATVQIATMVQADNGGHQDFVYLEFQPVSTTAPIVFNACNTLTSSQTATPAFTRSYGWTIGKSVDQTSVTTSADTATFTYDVVVTKSAPADSGWKVTGAITVTNPNTFSVADVLVTELGVDNGGTCGSNGPGAIGTLGPGQSAAVGYACTYVARPAQATGTNTANVSWTLATTGGPETQSQTISQPFAFGEPSATVHDSVDVADSFDGARSATIPGGASVNASRTFAYSRTVTVPASGCWTYDNTATVTPTDTPTALPGASVGVVVCRETPPVAPASAVTKRTTISLQKQASTPTVAAGATVSFVIRWQNTGKVAARNVEICDALPGQMSFVSARGATFENGKACWVRKTVAPGAKLIFHVVARVSATVGNARLVNVATATASNAPAARATAPVHARRHARTRPAGVTG